MLLTKFFRGGLRPLCRVLSSHLGAKEPPPFFAEEKLSFHDPVHHQVDLNKRLKSIVDTRYFQRLREIKQLGATCYVYPSANHTRFEHSIGSAFLAEKMLESLWMSNSRDERDHNADYFEVHKQQINEKDYMCVAIAALCHDIGHGPFSHLYDSLFLKRLKDVNKPGDPDLWKHEGRAVEILKFMMENDNLKEILGLDDSDLRTIYKMIANPPKFDEAWTEAMYLPKEKSYLYEIVANKITEIDVDKMDYLLRDGYSMGLPGGFEWRRYFENIRVRQVPIDGEVRYQICSRRKEAHNLHDLFHHRVMYHRRAYQHKTTTAVQVMMADALLLSNSSAFIRGKDDCYYSLSKAPEDVDAFLRLTDSIQQLIQNTATYHGDEHTKSLKTAMTESKAPIFIVPSLLVDQAKAILQRIEKRQLYTYIERITVPYEKFKSSEECSKKIAEDLYEAVPELKELEDPTFSLLEVTDPVNCPSRAIYVYVTIIGYAQTNFDASPLENHYVFKKRSINDNDTLQQLGTISRLFPHKDIEREVYVYLRPDLADDKVKKQTLVNKLRESFNKLQEDLQ